MPDPTADRIARDSMVRMRWAAVGALSLTVGFAGFGLGHPLSVPAVVAVLAATAWTNVALGRSAHPAAAPAAVIFDLAALTTILALTGGASNPFSVLYLLHVALAAVVLGPTWTWIVAAGAAAGFAVQFLFTDPHAMHQGEGAIAAHLWGMWAALTVTGFGIATFVANLSQAIRDREAELARLRRAADQQERVMSLATLAAGAAHELGSPLAVIAVAAGEIAGMADGAVAEEAGAIRAQVERCRAIVARLTHRAGAGQAEPIELVQIEDVWADLRDGIRERDRVHTSGGGAVRAPRAALVEALGSLVRNALQAGTSAVRVSTRERAGRVVFEVEDDGGGMDAATLARVGEPFFTTRAPGDGMGLGVFLVRRFAQGLGGSVELQSVHGKGTTVRLCLPR